MLSQLSTVLIYILTWLPSCLCLPVPSEDGVWGTYSRSSYYYSNYSFPKTSAPRNPFLPKPQKCSDTGRTVCTVVDQYPFDHIFDVLNKVKTRGFNFSSVFFDEREGDAEPTILPEFPVAPEETKKHEGFLIYQTSVHYQYSKPTTKSWDYGPHAYPRHTKVTHPHLLTQLPFHAHRSLVRRAEDEEPACAIRSTFISPKAALSDKSEWKYIVNVAERDPRLRQVIRVDICSSPDESCSSQVSLPLGYTSRCMQKYIKKKLLSLDADGQGTSEENFFVPSCCLCQISRSSEK
ncbi:uncharacterized protein LOC143246551 [Tachypleus tridentatus]|uniref:uncharacterized protein LOC143246551 n=1 Tax=Tachypleus tridentatus TaxID=6853 RepID=UPI003FCF987E